MKDDKSPKKRHWWQDTGDPYKDNLRVILVGVLTIIGAGIIGYFVVIPICIHFGIVYS